jgi:hypothetical protein
MKIVIIGGTGLIGSKTVAILRRLTRDRRQHYHRRGAQRGSGRRAGGDRPRELAVV